MAPNKSPRRPLPLGARSWVLLALLGAAVWSFVHLGLGPDELLPTDRGWDLAERFVGRALSPALSHEGDTVEGRPSIWVEALEALGLTVLFAAAAMGLALIAGLILGFFASTAWWAGDPGGGNGFVMRWLRRTIFPAVYVFTRVLIAVMRSIHELFWALLFMAMASVSLSDAAAVLALAIPYTGILAKIFSEMIDEAPRGPAHALRATGARGVQTFLVGLVPAALPDMVAYVFYRFECALRSSAVIGFFGTETIGHYIDQSFKSTHFGEVWTYLYVLIAAILIFDLWSGAVRRRLLT